MKNTISGTDTVLQIVASRSRPNGVSLLFFMQLLLSIHKKVTMQSHRVSDKYSVNETKAWYDFAVLNINKIT